MAISNQVNALIPAAVLNEVVTKINEVSTALKPYLHALTSEERSTLPKMGDKTIAFVQKSSDYIGTNPEYVPAFLEPAELANDLGLVKQLQPLLGIATQLSSNIDDTALLASSEAYQQALVYYRSVKGAAIAGQPGARDIYDDLQERFPGSRGRKQGPPSKP
jgi:hypothetical protein